jgi:hypothetical protein
MVYKFNKTEIRCQVGRVCSISQLVRSSALVHKVSVLLLLPSRSIMTVLGSSACALDRGCPALECICA